MTTNGYLQLILYMVVLIALAKPLGWYSNRKLICPVLPRTTSVWYDNQES